MKLLNDLMKEFELFKMKNVELDTPEKDSELEGSEPSPGDNEFGFSAEMGPEETDNDCTCSHDDSEFSSSDIFKNLIDTPFDGEEDEDSELDMNLLDFNTDDTETINTNTTLPPGEFKYI